MRIWGFCIDILRMNEESFGEKCGPPIYIPFLSSPRKSLDAGSAEKRFPKKRFMEIGISAIIVTATFL
jgi:hypothetical protein